MRVSEHHLVPQGQAALVRNGEVVWAGPLIGPWSEVEYDIMLVSPSDFKEVRARFAHDE